MKKLLALIFLVVSAPALSMDKPENTRKRKVPQSITYHDQSAIRPYRIVALDNDTTVGCIVFGQDPEKNKRGNLTYLMVQEAYRGQGIGYRLFKKAIYQLIRKGYRKITWDAMDLEDIGIENLEAIYVNYIKKLKEELEFDFSMDYQYKNLNLDLIPMKISLKR